LNDLGKFIQMRNKPAPLNESVIRHVEFNSKQTASDICDITPQSLGNVECIRKTLFERPTTPIPQQKVAVVWTDLEWNRSGQIISVGAYYEQNDTKLSFYSLVKHKSAEERQIFIILLQKC
jgi:hypothetical protein